MGARKLPFMIKSVMGVQRSLSQKTKTTETMHLYGILSELIYRGVKSMNQSYLGCEKVGKIES